MKKKIPIALSLALALALAGCGAQTQTTTESASDTSEETTASQTYATNITVDADAETTSTVNGLDDGLCSWNEGGQDAGTTEGDDYALTPVVYINNGEFDSEKSLTDEDIASDKMSSTSIVVNKEAVNGVIVNDSDYTIEDSNIQINADDADGTTTCDFSGLGSALAVYGDSNVTVKNTNLTASGVADMGLFVDNGATVLLDNVTISSKGGTLYSDYVNSPAQETMAAPPWILGIMGNSRASNLMGDNSTLTVIDSDASASNWAVLSTDSGSSMMMNVVNSSLSLTGSDNAIQDGGKFDTENPYTSKNGYGTYVIGNSTQNFIGDTFNVGTYAAIFTGGTATYSNLVKGESYDLLAADGSTQTTYDATEDVQTVINSDTFGFMAHQNTNSCTLDGVQVNSEFTDFLVKSGNDTTITVENGAELNAGNGILLQLLDNDDSTTDFDSDAKTFAETHEEYEGFPTEAVADSTTAGNNMQPSDLPSGGGDQSQGSGNSDDQASNSSSDSQTPPETPSGDNSGQAPSGSSDGQAPSGDNSGQASSGSSDSQTPPETPSGDNGGQAPSGSSDGQAPSGDNSGQAPSGSSDSQTPPEKPTGDASGSSDNGQAPAGDANGTDSSQAPSGSSDNGQAPSGDSSGSSDQSGSSSSTSNTTTYNVIDTDLEGAIYNGIGWDANELSSGNVKQMELKVNLSGTSTLKGAIAMTSCIHATYDGETYLKENKITAFDDDDEAAEFAEKYQATSFSQSEYFNIGQVANLVKSNGINNIDVTLSDSAVWTVSDTSLISSLKLSDDAKVVVEKDVTLTVDDKEYTEGTYTASDFK